MTHHAPKPHILERLCPHRNGNSFVSVLGLVLLAIGFCECHAGGQVSGAKWGASMAGRVAVQSGRFSCWASAPTCSHSVETRRELLFVLDDQPDCCQKHHQPGAARQACRILQMRIIHTSPQPPRGMEHGHSDSKVQTLNGLATYTPNEKTLSRELDSPVPGASELQRNTSNGK